MPDNYQDTEEYKNYLKEGWPGRTDCDYPLLWEPFSDITKGKGRDGSRGKDGAPSDEYEWNFASPEAGRSPRIIKGRWWNWDPGKVKWVDTGVEAKGADAPVPEIRDGMWYIGDSPTGVSAAGSDWVFPRINEETFEWEIWRDGVWVKTGVKAKGADGVGHEFVFIANKSGTAPNNPTPNEHEDNLAYQQDDYIPSGWSDDPPAISDKVPYAFASERKKSNGVWGRFSNPTLWARYSKDGKEGKNGSSVIVVYKNSDTKPAKPTQTAQEKKTQTIPSGWKAEAILEEAILENASSGIDNVRYTGAWIEEDGGYKSNAIGHNQLTVQRLTFNAQAAAKLAIVLSVSSEKNYDVLAISHVNQSISSANDYNDESKIKLKTSGDGTDLVVYDFPQSVTDAFIDIAYKKDSSGSNGSDTAHFKLILQPDNAVWWQSSARQEFAADGSWAMSDWSEPVKISGDQGIPGAPGADGRTSYLHIAYADTLSGGGFSQDPAGKKYIGTYTDFVQTDSSDPSRYKWALIKGADGDKMSPIEFQRRLAANLDWSPNLLFSLPNLGQNGWHTETTFNKNLAANGWLNIWTTLPGWGRMIFYAHASAFATVEVGKSYTLSYELYVYKGATQADGIGVWPIGLTPHTKGDQWTAEDIGWIEPNGTTHAQNSTRAILRATNGEPTSSPLQKPYKIYRTVTFSGTAANAKLYFGFGNESSTSKQVDVYIGNIKLEQNDKPTPLTAPYETYMRYLTASTVRTATVGKRWALNDDGSQSLRFYNNAGNLCMEMDVAESNDPAVGLNKGDFFMSLFGPGGSTLFIPGRQPRVISAWERWGQTAMGKEVSNAVDGKKPSQVFVSPHIYAKLTNETPSEDDPNTKWYENRGMTLANGMYADAPPDRSLLPGDVSVPVYLFSGGKRSLTPHHYRVVKVDELELPNPGEGVLT